jgi:hypothetical protein
MRHRKTARLMRVIGATRKCLVGPRGVARAVLELLWDVAYENGDPILGSTADVEYQADWLGEVGKLTQALVDSGFLDDDDGLYKVHDLLDHAPDYVRRRLSRERQRQDTGNHYRSLTRQRPVSDQSVTIPPAPAPVGSGSQSDPAPKEDLVAAPLVAGGDVCGVKSPSFEELVSRWNSIQGIRTTRAASDARKKVYSARRKDPWWVANLDAALAKVAASDFCRGRGEKSWVADIDWFLRAGTVAGLIEGKYDNRTQPADQPQKVLRLVGLPNYQEPIQCKPLTAKPNPSTPPNLSPTDTPAGSSVNSPTPGLATPSAKPKQPEPADAGIPF